MLDFIYIQAAPVCVSTYVPLSNERGNLTKKQKTKSKTSKMQQENK